LRVAFAVVHIALGVMIPLEKRTLMAENFTNDIVVCQSENAPNFENILAGGQHHAQPLGGLRRHIQLMLGLLFLCDLYVFGHGPNLEASMTGRISLSNTSAIFINKIRS
jgi:hypothetical protein